MLLPFGMGEWESKGMEEIDKEEKLKEEKEAPIVQYVVLRKDLIDEIGWPR